MRPHIVSGLAQFICERFPCDPVGLREESLRMFPDITPDEFTAGSFTAWELLALDHPNRDELGNAEAAASTARRAQL